MKRKAKGKPKTKPKSIQKQKQTVVVNIHTSKPRKRKASVGVQKGQAAPLVQTIQTPLYHQYYSPIPQPPRSIVAQTINPIADNVLPSVAKAEQIVNGAVLDGLYKIKEEKQGLKIINIHHPEPESKGLSSKRDIDEFLASQKAFQLPSPTPSIAFQLPSPTPSMASGSSSVAMGPSSRPLVTPSFVTPSFVSPFLKPVMEQKNNHIKYGSRRDV